MKWLLIALLLVAPAITQAQLTGQSSIDRLADVTRVSSTDGYVGQLAPVTFTWGDTLFGSGAAITSKWRQIGWSRTGSFKSNTTAMQFNPDKFNIIVALEAYGAGDSVGQGAMRFECALDTTDSTTYPIWIADSSNFLVADGNYNLPTYGTWTYEDQKGTIAQYCTGKVWLYFARVPCGSYMRLVSTPAAIADTTKRTITVWGER